MKQVTEWVETAQMLDFAVKQLEKYGTEPIILKQAFTGLIALFRADMNDVNEL